MRSINPDELTDVLIELRDKGFNTIAVAKRISVSHKTVHTWLNQSRFPRPVQLRKVLRLAASCGVPFSLTADSLKQRAVGFPSDR
jgi:hypothetical protein